MLTLLVAAQAAVPAPAASTAVGSQRWSILTPAEACRSRTVDDKDVVVCAKLPSAQRLPLPDERAPPDRPRQATGDYRDNPGGGTPCAATQWGCASSVALPLIPLAKGAIGLVKDALAKRPDKTGHIPIPLDDPAPQVSRIAP